MCVAEHSHAGVGVQARSAAVRGDPEPPEVTPTLLPPPPGRPASTRSALSARRACRTSRAAAPIAPAATAAPPSTHVAVTKRSRDADLAVVGVGVARRAVAGVDARRADRSRGHRARARAIAGRDRARREHARRRRATHGTARRRRSSRAAPRRVSASPRATDELARERLAAAVRDREQVLAGGELERASARSRRAAVDRDPRAGLGRRPSTVAGFGLSSTSIELRLPGDRASPSSRPGSSRRPSTAITCSLRLDVDERERLDRLAVERRGEALRSASPVASPISRSARRLAAPDRRS